MLGVPLHCAGECAPLNVFAQRNHFFYRVGVIDALDVLFDDWALIEVSGDVMRGCADQFDAAVICLVVGTRALETGQEDRKSTRLNSSHVAISYAVFCL